MGQRGVRNLRALAAQRIAFAIEGGFFPDQRHRRPVGRSRDQKAASTPPHADFDNGAFPRAGRDDACQQPFRFLLGNADIKTAARRQSLHGGGQRRVGGQHAARAHVEPQKHAEGMMRRAAPVQRLRGAEQGVRFLYIHVVLSGAQEGARHVPLRSAFVCYRPRMLMAASCVSSRLCASSHSIMN